VEDIEAPELTYSDYSSCADDANGKVVNYTIPVATDNCGVSQVYLVSGPANGSIFPVGITNVTYEALDVNGNTSQCTLTVTIFGPAIC